MDFSFGFGFGTRISTALAQYLIDYSGFTPLAVQNTTSNGIEANKRYIKDKGISPKYPLALYGGQGVKFNGTNQYIDLGYYVTHTSTATISFNITITSATHLQYVILGTDRIVIHGSGASTYMQCDFRSAGGSADVAITNPLGLGTHNIVLVANNGTFTSYVDGVLNKTVTQPFSGMKHKYIGSREGSSGFLNETLKDLYIFNRALTPAEITKAYQYPEDFFIDVTNGTVTDCVLNMPMNERGAYANYVVDYEGYSEGVETLDGTLVNTGCLANGTTYTAQASSNDRVKLGVDETLLGGTVTNKFILCKMLVANGTANSRLRLASNENSFTVHSEINGATDGWYYLLGYVESATSIYPLVYPDRVSPYDSSIDILEWSIKEISGIYPITNPTTDTRDLAKNLPYGLQSNLMITDDNGVITGKSSYLEGDGVSYADTGWIPSADEDVTVEMIISTSKEGIIDIHGTDADYGFNFGIYSEVTALVKCFGKLIHYQVNGDYIYLSCVYNGTTKKFIPYFNDYKYAEQAVVNTVSGTSSFTLGKRNQLNTPYPDSSPIRLFKVHNKALTQEEVTENYNKVYFDGLLAPDDAIRDENGKVIFDEDGNYILLGE